MIQEDKIIADNRAQGFDPASELPADEREDAEQSEISECMTAQENENSLEEMFISIEEMLSSKDFNILADETIRPAICEITGIPVK